MTEGLLLLLRDVLLVLPDNMAHQVLSYVTKFEILLVMANHENHSVRSAVVQVSTSGTASCLVNIIHSISRNKLTGKREPLFRFIISGVYFQTLSSFFSLSA